MTISRFMLARVQRLWLLVAHAATTLFWLCPAEAGSLHVDLTAYCRAKGFQGVTNANGNGYGWRCTPINSFQIDVNEACRQQHGALSQAYLISNPPGGVYDWRCTGAAQVDVQCQCITAALQSKRRRHKYRYAEWPRRLYMRPQDYWVWAMSGYRSTRQQKEMRSKPNRVSKQSTGQSVLALGDVGSIW